MKWSITFNPHDDSLPWIYVLSGDSHDLIFLSPGALDGMKPGMSAPTGLIIYKGERAVYRGASAFTIPARAFELLVVLAERQGVVVDVRHIMGRLWPGRDVSEANLRNNVNILRRALGDVIVNVAGRGYLLAERALIKEEADSWGVATFSASASGLLEGDDGTVRHPVDPIGPTSLVTLTGYPDVGRSAPSAARTVLKWPTSERAWSGSSRDHEQPAIQPEPTEVVHVGRVAIFMMARDVQVRGLPAKVGDRAFDILLTLVEDIGEVVDKAHLMSRAWPDTVVGEAALRVHMTMLRKALGSEARLRIEAVPGRGYRLIVQDEPSDRGTWPLLDE